MKTYRYETGYIQRAIAKRLGDGPCTEVELVARLCVSLHLVRYALRELERTGRAEKNGEQWRLLTPNLPGRAARTR